MAHFNFQARQKDGQLVQGVIEATDKTAAIMRLRTQGLFPIKVTLAFSGTSQQSKTLSLFSGKKVRKPKLIELARYIEQLASLLKAGMPLTMALQSMGQLNSKGISSEISLQLRREILEGRSLSEAMSKIPSIFPDLCVSMVRAGEQSGALVDVLFRLAKHYQQFAQLRQRVISALTYPVIVLVVGTIVLIFFLTVMLPRFMEIFIGMDIPLPWSTRLVIGLSNFFAKFWWLIGGLFIISWILFRRWAKTPSGRYKLDRWVLELPLIGLIIRYTYFSQFARTLSTLLRNGVPVLQSLRITEEVIQNTVLRDAIKKTRNEVTDGKTISQPLLKSGLFPQLLVDLIRIGEETGDVPSALDNAAESFERDLTTLLNLLMDVIGPVMIILLALLVGFLVFSVLSAMFAITGSIGRGI